MTFLFFDTETTGLSDRNMPPSWEAQPHICQLGAILTDAQGKVKAEMNFLVRPVGWTIPKAASDIHGISQPDAEKYGLSIKGVLTVFARLASMAEVLVAHNLPFDLFMLEIECARTGLTMDLPPTSACTMAESAPILQIPPTAAMLRSGRTNYKSPNLQEAYRHFFGRNFEGAHDAMADVRACKDVFFRLRSPGTPDADAMAARHPESKGVAA